MKKKFGSSKKSSANIGKALAAMSGVGSLPPAPAQMGGPPGMPPAGPPGVPPAGMAKGGRVKDKDGDYDNGMAAGGCVKGYSTGGSVAKGAGLASRGSSYKVC